MRVAAVLLAASLLATACRVELGPPSGRARSSSGEVAGKVWVYTSLYSHVVEALDALAQRKLPQLEVEWFAAGSEKVAARVDAELAAGAIRADLLLTSDPFFFARMKREGQLLPYVPPAALRVPRELVDLDGAWITSRAAVMVIVYNTKRFDPNTAPKSYAELADPRLKGQVIFGDPLASGTFFTTVAFLQDRFGWEYFDRLKQNGLLSTGGNSAVIERVSSGELGTGLVLLENVLAAKRKGAPIDYLLPAEGPVLIPGPAAIFAGTANPAGAKALMDLIFSPEAQALLVEQGDMHSPDPRQAPPEGAPPWDQLMKDALPWSERFIEQVEHNAAELRSTYNQRVQR